MPLIPQSTAGVISMMRPSPLSLETAKSTRLVRQHSCISCSVSRLQRNPTLNRGRRLQRRAILETKCPTSPQTCPPAVPPPTMTGQSCSGDRDPVGDLRGTQPACEFAGDVFWVQGGKLTLLVICFSNMLFLPVISCSFRALLLFILFPARYALYVV